MAVSRVMSLSATPAPATMHAALLTGHGGYERLEIRDDVPTPTPGRGEVLIRLSAAAVNNTDINLRLGWYSKSVVSATGRIDAETSTISTDAGWDGAAVRFPLIQGADGCGKVVAIGPGADQALLGERVLIDPIVRRDPIAQSGESQKFEYIGTDRDGCFAEYIAVPAANALPVRSRCTDLELASFPCSCVAAENMLARSEVGEGDRVLVTGASGGVGSAAVQLARRRGAHVMAISSAEKMAAIRALGANLVVARDADLRELLGEASIDVVIDCVGGSQFGGLLAALRRGGRYAVAGAIAGPVVELDLRTLYLKDLTFFGCTIAEPRIFREIVGYIERDEIRPLVAERFPLDRIVDAQQAFLGKQHIGKIMIEIARPL